MSSPSLNNAEREWCKDTAEEVLEGSGSLTRSELRAKMEANLYLAMTIGREGWGAPRPVVQSEDDNKAVINWQSVKRVRAELLSLNLYDIKDITWVDNDGKVFPFDPATIDQWRYTGLNNADFALYVIDPGEYGPRMVTLHGTQTGRVQIKTPNESGRPK